MCQVACICDLRPLMVLVEHEVGPCLLLEEHGLLTMAKSQILAKVGVLVAVYFDEEVHHGLLCRDCQHL